MAHRLFYIFFFISFFSFRSGAQQFYESAKLLADVPTMNSQFGTAVDIEGNYAIVGAPLFNRAYVYEKMDGTWTFKKKLLPVWGDDGMFGRSVSIYDSVAVVGCPNESSIDPDMGSVYVYRRNATTWVFEQELIPSDLGPGDFLGASVAVYDNTIVVGSPGNDFAGENSGCMYVYIYNGTTWVETDQIVGSHTNADDSFGLSVAICDSVIVAGAPEANTGAGNMHVFKFDGVNWNQTNWYGPTGGAPYDGYGYSVSITQNHIIAGAYRHDEAAPDAGSAYVYTKNTSGDWYYDTKLTPSGASSGDWFGFSVSISGDWAVIGSNISVMGQTVYLFNYNGTSWTEVQPLAQDDAETGDLFGLAVAISGTNVLVGDIGDDDAGNHTGSAYIFSKAFANTPAPDTESTLFSVYPNPSNGIINLHLKSGSESEISIFDCRMQLIVSFQSDDEFQQYNFEDYSRGIYFIRVSSDDGSGMQKIVLH